LLNKITHYALWRYCRSARNCFIDTGFGIGLGALSEMFTRGLYSVLADYRKFKWRINTSAYSVVTYYYQPLIMIYASQRIWWLLQH